MSTSTNPNVTGVGSGALSEPGGGDPNWRTIYPSGVKTDQQLVEGIWVTVQASSANGITTPSGMTVGLNSIHLNDAASIGATGEGVAVVDGITKKALMPIGITHKIDGSGWEAPVVDIPTTPTGAFVDPFPTPHASLSQGYSTSRAPAADTTVSGIEFVPGETYAGTCTWSIKDVATNIEIVRKRFTGVTDGVARYVQFSYPIHLHAGVVVASEIVKDIPGTLLLCRMSTVAPTELHRRPFQLTSTPKEILHTGNTRGRASITLGLNAPVTWFEDFVTLTNAVVGSSTTTFGYINGCSWRGTGTAGWNLNPSDIIDVNPATTLTRESSTGLLIISSSTNTANAMMLRLNAAARIFALGGRAGGRVLPWSNSTYVNPTHGRWSIGLNTNAGVGPADANRVTTAALLFDIVGDQLQPIVENVATGPAITLPPQCAIDWYIDRIAGPEDFSGLQMVIAVNGAVVFDSGRINLVAQVANFAEISVRCGRTATVGNLEFSIDYLYAYTHGNHTRTLLA